MYENAAIYSKKKGIIERKDVDVENSQFLTEMKALSISLNEPVYVIREFIIEDSIYQEKQPWKLAKDWYVLEIK